MTPISRDSYARFLNQYSTLAKERHQSVSYSQVKDSEVNFCDDQIELDPLTEEYINLQDPSYDATSFTDFHNQSLSVFSSHNFKN